MQSKQTQPSAQANTPSRGSQTLNAQANGGDLPNASAFAHDAAGKVASVQFIYTYTSPTGITEIVAGFTTPQGITEFVEMSEETATALIKEGNFKNPLAPPETPTQPPQKPVEMWPKKDLQAALVKRGLKKSGNKVELIRRLKDDIKKKAAAAVRATVAPAAAAEAPLEDSKKPAAADSSSDDDGECTLCDYPLKEVYEPIYHKNCVFCCEMCYDYHRKEKKSLIQA